MVDFSAKKISGTEWLFVSNSRAAQNFEIQTTGGMRHQVAGPDISDFKKYANYLVYRGFTIDGPEIEKLIQATEDEAVDGVDYVVTELEAALAKSEDGFI